MKKVLLSVGVILALASLNKVNAQILDEQNVTITMDLQPVLQLKLEGSNQIDFTFDEINEYYGGITQYGANVLKVSSSVSFDLWAVGLSQGNVAARCWDQQLAYQGGGASSVNTIPLTALELHQFPPNPNIAAARQCDGATAMTLSSDYSSVFGNDTTIAGVSGNNAIYNQLPTTPYIAPAYNEVVGTQQEKMIAGHSDGGAQNCHVVGGSYLTESMNFATGVPSNGGYYFVMDYRILPGLPAVFPFHRAPRNANSTSPSLVAADVAAGGALGHDGGLTYAAPGVYTMYIKYIIAEDQ